MPTNRVYQTRVKNVLAYLSRVVVATALSLLEATGVQPHDIRRMIGEGILSSSLNYNRNWLIPTKIIRKRKDRSGFYRHRIERYSRTIPIFHSKRTAKATLSYLVSKRPWGLTLEEANELLGRDCKRVLEQLVDTNSISVRLLDGVKVYLNRAHKRAEQQLNRRRTNPRFKKDEDEDDRPEVGVVTYEEFCRVFQQSLSKMGELPNVSPDRLSALLLMFTTNRSLRTTESWITFNPRLQDAIGSMGIVDHTTLFRDFDKVGPEFLKRLFHKLVIKLHDRKVITGRFLVVDATHIYAYCNRHKDTTQHPVEGAKWGYHHGSFYGYKVHILIDADSELPLAMILSPGNDHDSIHFIPLLERFDEDYDFEEVLGVLADGAYDVGEFREVVRDKTGGIFLPACNPRKSKPLARMKLTVKKLFEKHGQKIKSVQGAFKLLKQKFLSDFGFELGTANESKLVELISERLHRPFRAAVERVFSRLKALVAFETPRSRRLNTVLKGIWWCLIGQLIQALSAYEKGIPGSMRKRTALV